MLPSKSVWCLLCCICTVISSATQNDVENVLQFLDWGEENFKFDDLSQFSLVLGDLDVDRLSLITFLTKDSSEIIIHRNNGGKFLFPTLNRNDWLPIPEIYTSNSKETFVDFPLIQYTGNLTMDFAHLYFSSKLLETNKLTKLILSVKYDARTILDHSVFESTISKLSQLLVNVEKFNESMILIVNEFDNTVPYHSAITSIANFLINYKLKLGTGKLDSQKKIKIIDTLLKKNRIGVVYKPDRKGSISNSKLLLNNRNNLFLSVQESYNVRANLSDFNFTAIPDELIQFVKDNIFDASKLRIMNMTEIVSSQLLDIYKWKGRHNTNMQLYLDQVQSLYELLSTKINSYLSRKGFEIAINACIDEIQKIMVSVVSKGDFLSVLSIFDNVRIVGGINQDMYEEWNEPMLHLLEKVKEFIDWYTVFQDSYYNAGTYEHQVSKYSTFGGLMDPNYSVYKSGINDFLNKIDSAGLADSDTIADLKTVSSVDDFIIRDADAIVTLLRPNVTCSGTILKVHSNYVIMTKDVIAKFCSGLTRIEILAMETLYVDTDIILNDRETHIIVIADNWVIVGGDKEINLQGKNGADQSPAIDEYDGAAGHPGTPGGSIFAVASKINTVGGKLTFITNGGNGGNGQHAGKGKDGENGATYPDYYETEWYKGDDPDGYLEDEYQSLIRSRGLEIHQSLSKQLFYDVNEYANHFDQYEIYRNREHIAPFNGKNGGQAGLGAKNGDIILIPLDGSLPVTQYKDPGQNGMVGDGGAPGKAALGYGTVTTRCLFYRHTKGAFNGNHAMSYDCDEIFKHERESYSASSGSAGTAGTPITPTDPTTLVKESTIVDYKCMLFKTRFARSRDDYINDFASNSQVLNLYSLSSYIAETKCINTNAGVSRELMKQSYIDPILNKLESWSGTTTDIAVAKYIRGALTAMAWNVKTVVPNVFVTDLGTYVTSIEGKVSSIDVTSVRTAAESVRDDFKGLVQSNILEARKFIDTFVTNNVNEVLTSLNEATYQSINFTELLLKNNETELEELSKELRELKRNIRDSLQASVYRTIGSALRIIPIVGEVTSLCDDLIKQVIGSKPTDIFDKNNIGGAVNFATAEINKFLNSKMIASEMFVDLLNHLVDTLADDSPIEIAFMLDDMRDNVNDALAGAQKHNKFRKLNTQPRYILNNNLTLTDKIANEIARTEENTLKLIEYEESLYLKIKPMLDQMKSDLAAYSVTDMDVKKWEVKKNINAIRNLTVQFATELNNFKHFFAIQDDASDLCVTQFDQIQMYEEHKFFATYITDLNLQPVSGTYSNDVDYLELSMKQNILTQQTETAEASLMQKIIPLADKHQTTLGGYYVLKETDTISTVKSFCTSKLNYIQTQLNSIKSTITETDTNFGYSEFHSNSSDVVPFYILRHNKYHREIYDLIYGQEAAFTSTVYGTPYKNCVRFSEAVLDIKSANSTFQAELDTILKGFHIEQTHIGNSMFKYVNKTFNVRSNAVQFVYSIEKDINGEPISFNEAYTKAKTGDIILSPHATWKVKLIELDEGNFQLLQDFYVEKLGEINLELVGKGKFLRDLKTKRKNLEEFYEVRSKMFPMLKGYVIPPENHYKNVTRDFDGF